MMRKMLSRSRIDKPSSSIIRIGIFSLFTTMLIASGIIAIPNAESFLNTYYGIFTKWGVEGSGNGEFKYPSAVGVDPTTHDVYVADSNNNRIQKFRLDGTGVILLTEWGNFGTGEKQFNNPAGVGVDSSNHFVYVADYGNNRIQKFTSSGDFIRAWGGQSTQDGKFKGPQGVAVDPSTHEVYVADDYNNRVQKFTNTGVFITNLGNGNINHPRGIALDPSTHEVYVADAGSNSIKKFTNTGIQIAKWDNYGSDHFKTPEDVAIDSSTHQVYVADDGNGSIEIFKLTSSCPTGTTEITPGVCFIAKVGSTGSGNDQFTRPAGVGVDSSTHKSYAADTGNHRIQVIALLVLNTPSNNPLPH
jgi:DNA-binding beta-propeller fold protein YncE